MIHIYAFCTKNSSLFGFIEEIMQQSHLNNLYAIRLIATKAFGSHGKRWIFLSNSNAKFDPKFFAISLVSDNYMFYSQKVPKWGILNWHIIVSRFFFFPGSGDTNLKLWDIRRKGCIFTYKGHSETVTCLKFSPDGQWVASGGEEGAVKVSI